MTKKKKTLSLRHNVNFHVGIHLCDEIQPLTSLVLHHSGPFFLSSEVIYKFDIWLLSIGCAFLLNVAASAMLFISPPPATTKVTFSQVLVKGFSTLTSV